MGWFFCFRYVELLNIFKLRHNFLLCSFLFFLALYVVDGNV